MIEIFSASGNTVRRRTGGLERPYIYLHFQVCVRRRTGGLEKNTCVCVVLIPVRRRTGGLEILNLCSAYAL